MNSDMQEYKKVLNYFRETIVVCKKPLDAYHTTLQSIAKISAKSGAICLLDENLKDKLVVRLSFNMDGASNKILSASTFGKIAIYEAFKENSALFIEDFEKSEFKQTDLEEKLNFKKALYLPITYKNEITKAIGVITIIPKDDEVFSDEKLNTLKEIVSIFSIHLQKITEYKQKIEDKNYKIDNSNWSQEFSDSFQSCLDTPDIEKLSDKTLEYCRKFTKSEFGFVGYIDPESGFLIAPTMTKDIFPACSVDGKTVIFEKAGGLGGYVLDNKKPLIANEPFTHHASVGTPPGHLPIRKFMGVPCFFQGKVVGMIALANKDENYNSYDLGITSAFASIYATAVERFFSDKKLIETRDKYTKLYNESPCGYYTFSLNGKVLEINETALKILEIKNRDLNIHDLLSSDSKIVFEKQLKELKDKKEGILPVELHFIKENKEVLTALHSISGEFDERGFLLTIHSTILDITHSKKTEEKLRETRDYLENMFNFSNSLIIAWDYEFIITRFNPAFERLSGYRVDKVVGKALGEFFPNLLNIKSNNKNSIEASITTKSGEVKTILWNLSDIYKECCSESIATIAQGINITKRKEIEDKLNKKSIQLEALNRELELKVKEEVVKQREQEKLLIQQSRLAQMGEMIGAIAHQWRQPLNALGLSIQELQEAYEYGELNDEYLELMVNKSMDRIEFMSSTIDDFRNFFTPNKQKISFNPLESIKEILEVLSAQLKHHFIDTVIESKFKHSNKIDIIGYSSEFKQVIINILNNAKDAIVEEQESHPNKKGEIYISIDSKEKNLIISIEDNSIGIDEKVIDRIFDPYFTTKEQGKGTGLGLYMSKLIIEKHMKGKLYAKNSNRGAKFIIELPKE